MSDESEETTFYDGYLRFWAKNQLTPIDGPGDCNCPKGTVRTDIPRSQTWDPTTPTNRKPNHNFFKKP